MWVKTSNFPDSNTFKATLINIFISAGDQMTYNIEGITTSAQSSRSPHLNKVFFQLIVYRFPAATLLFC